MKEIILTHGAGGRLMHELLHEEVFSVLQSTDSKTDDAAIFAVPKDHRLAFTTDSYVVTPLFFDGGDIGKLAVCGTVNDLGTSGAKPMYLTLSMILEEGFLISDLRKIVASIKECCDKAQVKIITGDTKVVERGRGDGIYLNTSGIGFVRNETNISSYNAKEGDIICVTGEIASHEVSLMLARKIIDLNISVASDVSPIGSLIYELLEKKVEIHSIKDPTRGGVASALYEIAHNSKMQITIDEELIQVSSNVLAVTELVGLDPLYLANEGQYIMSMPSSSFSTVKQVFPNLTKIGEVKLADKPQLLLNTLSGGIRELKMLETTQLPRIC